MVVSASALRRQFNSSKKPSILLFVGFLLLVTGTSLPGCSNEPDSWDRIVDTGVIRFGTDPTYPPFESDVEGDLQGLDVDLAHSLADELGLEARFVYFGYDGLYDALATARVDALISGLVVMPERMRDFSFSSTYFDAGLVLITPSNRLVANESDLEGLSLAVELGTLGHVRADNWYRQIPDINVLPFETSEEAVIAVSEDMANAAIVDAISGRLALHRRSTLAISPMTVSHEPFAIVVRAEDETLLNEINVGLDKLRNSGDLEAIISKWLDR